MMMMFSILACATCYGAPEASMTQGMNMAIFTLLGVTAVVLGAFVALFVHFARRARRYRAAEEILAHIPQGLPDTGQSHA